MALSWLLGRGNSQHEDTAHMWLGESCGYFVVQKGRSLSVNSQGGIVAYHKASERNIKCLGTGWTSAEALLEYEKIIKEMDDYCRKPDALWAAALIRAAERIDILSKTLDHSAGIGTQVE